MQRSELAGEIVRLQVQRIPIKAKGIAYLPEEILSVERASVDAWGMLGWHEGAWVVDAHNRAHPSRRGGGRRHPPGFVHGHGAGRGIERRDVPALAHARAVGDNEGLAGIVRGQVSESNRVGAGADGWPAILGV